MAQKELVTFLLCTDKLFPVSNQLKYALVLELGWESEKEMSKYNDFNWVFSYDHLLKSADLCKRNVYWKASVQNFIDRKSTRLNSSHTS